MVYMDRHLVECRNCGHEQGYNVFNGKSPALDRSIAVCDSCGFKSIWYNRKIELPDDVIEAAILLMTENVEAK